MIAIVIALLGVAAVASVIAFVLHGLDSRKHDIARRLVEEEIVKIVERGDAEIRKLKDPSAPISVEEAVNELRKTSDSGHTD